MKFLHNKKRMAIAVGIVTIVVAGGSVFAWKALQDETVVLPENPTGEINYNPPTQTELKETEQHKDDLVKRSQNTENSSQNSGSVKKNVNPVITSASVEGDSVVIASFVEGIFEEGGTCTVRLTQGTNVASKQVEAIPNVSTTSCKRVTFSRSELSGSGTWTATVTYESSSSKGISSQKEVVL